MSKHSICPTTPCLAPTSRSRPGIFRGPWIAPPTLRASGSDDRDGSTRRQRAPAGGSGVAVTCATSGDDGCARLPAPTQARSPARLHKERGAGPGPRGGQADRAPGIATSPSAATSSRAPRADGDRAAEGSWGPICVRPRRPDSSRRLPRRPATAAAPPTRPRARRDRALCRSSRQAPPTGIFPRPPLAPIRSRTAVPPLPAHYPRPYPNPCPLRPIGPALLGL